MEAIGRAGHVSGDWIKAAAFVIEVGMNRDEDGKLCNNVDFEAAREGAGWTTPIPGDVGPMTIARLLENTPQTARRRGSPVSAGLRATV